MLFNSIEFLFFLPIVFVLYWFVFRRSLRLQNAFIVAASYIFYGWWDWKFLLLIAFTSLCSWYSGLAIRRFQLNSNTKGAKAVLWSNILLNLFILGLFKYYNFFVSSFIDAFSALGVHVNFTTLKLILPVGISFYTFQALSYSIDVYKQKLEATKDPVAFFAYVSFFPQLVAGPIERATNLLPQILSPRHFSYPQAVDGCRQMLWGFFKKIVIADNCAIYANMAFEDYANQSAITLFFGAIMFTFQIYGDFSGYSDIAIGTSKLFGIKLMQNFKYPYFSRDIAEFWRRWHISLTTWFRDYIYIPLGGSRTTKAKVIRNTFIIFLVSGLWHGANWTFIAWGGYHAILFLPLIVGGGNRKYLNSVAEGKLFPSFRETIQMLGTFILVMIGWIIFRAPDITVATDYFLSMFDRSIFTTPSEPLLLLKLLIFCAALVLIEWCQRTKPHALDMTISSNVLKSVIYVLLLIVIMAASGNPATFIYFQF